MSKKRDSLSEQLLTLKQAATLLNVSMASLRRWSDSKTIPCYRVGAQKARRFRQEDVMAFISKPSEETRNGRTVQSSKVKPQRRNHGRVAGPGIKYGHHICALYGRPAGQLKLSVPMLRAGLEAGDLCFLVATQRSRDQILDALRRVYPNVRAAVEDGQLLFPECKGDKDQMLEQLEDLFLTATYSGEKKLRLVGDMEWTLAAGWNAQELYEYELLYNNRLGHRFPIATLCQYDVEAFPGRCLLDALKSHEDTFEYPIRAFCL